jgi:DNA-binding transcriptional ArsR family regulator
MARCSVCQHPQREQIDKMILRGLSGGEIAKRTGLHRSSVRRHRLAGLHLSSLTEQLHKGLEITARRREGAGRRYRKRKRAEEIQETVHEFVPPPPEPEPPPASREPVNPPNKLFSEADVAELLRQRRQWRRSNRGPRYGA